MNNPLSVEKLEKKVRYKNVTVIPIGSENFPNMVMIDKAPKTIKYMIGKKYITPEKAQLAIEAAQAEALINKGARSVKNELSSIGILTETAW